VKRSSLTGTQWHYGHRCGRLDRFGSFLSGRPPLPETLHHRGSITPACRPRRQEYGPSYATSLSIWFAKSQTNDPSSDAASAPPGTQNICLKYWGRRNV